MNCPSCSKFTPDESSFCQHCGSPIPKSNSGKHPSVSEPQVPISADFLSRIASIEERLVAIERRPASSTRSLPSELPNTSLLSDKFLTRAFTVWGHVFVAQLLIALPIYLLVVLGLLSS